LGCLGPRGCDAEGDPRLRFFNLCPDEAAATSTAATLPPRMGELSEGFGRLGPRGCDAEGDPRLRFFDLCPDEAAATSTATTLPPRMGELSEGRWCRGFFVAGESTFLFSSVALGLGFRRLEQHARDEERDPRLRLPSLLRTHRLSEVRWRS